MTLHVIDEGKKQQTKEQKLNKFAQILMHFIAFWTHAVNQGKFNFPILSVIMLFHSLEQTDT